MILSIDIGLRNLALCCMEAEDASNINSYIIHLWEVYNTLDSDDYKCEGIQKSGKICGKKCKYKYKKELGIVHSCKTHFPKNLNCNLKEHTFKKKVIDDYLLQDIAKILLCKIQDIYETELSNLDIKNIFIELQPKVNRKMVFVSHIVYGKLVELYKDFDVPIRFVRASQKLKAYTGPKIECKLKGKYSQRKWLSVEYCKWFLENKFSNEQKEKWLPFFESKTIKPDLGDTFLMTINALYGIPKKQRFQKNGKCIK
jgi:hypothetical protein